MGQWRGGWHDHKNLHVNLFLLHPQFRERRTIMCNVCRLSSSPPHRHHLLPPPSNGVERWPLTPWNLFPSRIHAASSSSSLLVTRHESSTSHSSLQEHALLLTPHVLEPRLASVPLTLATASGSSLIAATSSSSLLLPLPCHHQRSLSPPPLSLGLIVLLSAAKLRLAECLEDALRS